MSLLEDVDDLRLDLQVGVNEERADQIIAALEAAERLSSIVICELYHHVEDVRPTVDGQGTYSWCPSCDMPWPCRWSEAVAANTALMAALRGEEVSA